MAAITTILRGPVVSCQFSGRARNGAGRRGNGLVFGRPSTEGMALARAQNSHSRKRAGVLRWYSLAVESRPVRQGGIPSTWELASGIR